MCSVKLVSKDKNCFPFLLNPLTTASEETKILSAADPNGRDGHSIEIMIVRLIKLVGIRTYLFRGG